MKDIKLLPLWVCIIAGCVALFGNFYNGNQLRISVKVTDLFRIKLTA